MKAESGANSPQRSAAGLQWPNGMAWTVDQVDTCPSTNTELARRAKAGEAHAPYLLIALQQTAGLGRDGRTWVTPPRGALTMSALVNPQVPPEQLGLFPLFAALAVAEVLRAAGFPAEVKWPNDILLPAATPVDGFGNWRKVGGILAQVVAGAGVVVGIGVNIGQTEAELPVPSATSLALNGPVPDHAALVTGIAGALAGILTRWANGETDQLRAEYRQLSATIGQPVRAHAITTADDGPGGPGEPAGPVGTASDIADDGALIITGDDGAAQHVHAGDVWLRSR